MHRKFPYLAQLPRYVAILAGCLMLPMTRIVPGGDALEGGGSGTGSS